MRSCGEKPDQVPRWYRGEWCPFFQAKGGGVTTHAKGPQNPAKSRHHQSSSDGDTRRNCLRLSRGPPAVFREEISGSDVPREAPLVVGTLWGTWAGSTHPTAKAGPDYPLQLSPTRAHPACSPAGQHGFTWHYKPGGNLGFHRQKGKRAPRAVT